MLKLYTDAATKGNPGPSGAGILIVGHGEPVEQSVALPVMSNHQAEFRAAALGLEAVINQAGRTSRSLSSPTAKSWLMLSTSSTPSTLLRR
ncbi:RNase H family protein [Lacticaseibacillus pantheris]|uniref:RNase H family protein n=1 Tax=Lacticaseibacillus pantheris TaxID=171523 RepID=UPI000AD7EE63|nr:RNase H family protein [Lacticaseibacillus pantheris]